MRSVLWKKGVDVRCQPLLMSQLRVVAESIDNSIVTFCQGLKGLQSRNTSSDLKMIFASAKATLMTNN